MERYRVFAVEGLDATGKTTVSKMLAEEVGAHYQYYLPNDPNGLRRWKDRFDKALPTARFVFFTAAAIEADYTTQELRKTGDVYVDRTILSTIAYHSALGVPDCWFSLIPTRLIDNIDQVLYFTASENTRIARMQYRQDVQGFTTTASDHASLPLSQKVDEIYRSLTPDRTLVISTDDRTPGEIVSYLKGVVYERTSTNQSAYRPEYKTCS